MDTGERSRVIADLAREIEGQILDGRLGPRDRLPTEGELARQYATTRATVRCALDQLRARGLVHTVKGSGTYVRSPEWVSPTCAWTAPRYAC